MTVLDEDLRETRVAFIKAEPKQRIELLCRKSPAVWSTVKRGYTNAPVHREWYNLAMSERRLAVNAPRDHAKTEVFSVNMSAWRAIYEPGIWSYLFSATDELAKKLKERIDEAVRQAEPWLVDGATEQNETTTVYANGSRITVAGAGKAVRGAHPDVIVGDDVLEEKSTHTAYMRKKTRSWWFGTVANMAHPKATYRILPDGKRAWFGPTKIFLVGTPFHGKDLLMDMRQNPVYRYRRYAAEFDPDILRTTGSLAVEVN